VKKTSKWPIITVLTMVPLLMVLGNSVLIPGLPEMQSKMHVSKFQVSLLITLFSVPAGIVIPIAGFLSDRFSRKWVVIPSLLLFGIGGIIAGFASWFLKSPYVVVLVGRIIQGIGASGTAPIAMAWIGDLFSGAERSKVLGINEAGNAFGKVISPILGAAIAFIAWFSVFFIFPILCIPVAALLWWIVPEKKQAKSKQGNGLRTYVQSVVHIVIREGRWMTVLYFAGAAALFNLFGVLFYLSDLLENQYKIEGVIKGLYLAIPLVVLSATSFSAGAIIKRKKLLMKWMMVTGFIVSSLSLLTATWLAHNAWFLIGLMSFAAVGTGVVLPCLNMLITSAVTSESRGIVTSLYGSVRFLGVALGPPVYTWLLGISKTVMFITVAVLAAVCALTIAIFVHPEPNPDGSQRQVPKQLRIPGRHKARI
jgi:MFS transporter, ACDE family, multidrug resistance protein